MKKLILQSLNKRRIQTLSILFSVAISVAVLFALYMFYCGVSKGIETSKERMGADLIVVPAGAAALIDETELLFTGVPATVYMKKDVVKKMKAVKGVEQVTVQFYGQTLSQACCSTGATRRIIGYDPSTDWVITPWTKGQLNHDLKENEVIIGSDVGGFEGGSGNLLGHKVKAAAVLEPSGTGLDSSIFVDLDTARDLSRGLKGYEHFWQRYGQPDHLISAVLIKTEAGKKNSVANVIELQGDFKCITSSDVLADLQGQMKVIFYVMLGAGLLLCAASVLQLFARFFTMAWDRRTELGLYRAMGATRKDLQKLILGEAMILTLGGVTLGLLIGWGLYHLVLSFMSNQSAFSFISPGLSLVLGGVIGLAASFSIMGFLAVGMPLSQAGKVDPSAAMQKQDID